MNLTRHLPVWLWAWGAALAVLLFGLSIAGHAHEREGFYAGAGAGWSRLGNVETEYSADDFHDQWSAVAVIGHAWHTRHGVIAAELFSEYGRYGGDGKFDPFGEAATAGVLTITPCAVYTLDTALTIDPYLGGCVGFGYAGLDPKARDAFRNGEEKASFNAADMGWAWAARGGLGFDLTGDGRWRVNTEYRYTCLEGVSFTGPDHTDKLCRHSAGAHFVRFF